MYCIAGKLTVLFRPILPIFSVVFEMVVIAEAAVKTVLVLMLVTVELLVLVRAVVFVLVVVVVVIINGIL